MTQKRLITRSAFGHLLRTALILTVSATIFVEVAIAAQPTNSDAIAVIIANSEYRNEIPKVDYASNDGDAMKAFLRDVLGYRDGNIIDLRNAGQADILAVFGNERSHEGKLWSWVRPGRSDVF
ncbi:MAG: caspase family protein, partial [Rhodospirillaceae bacterium]|nr:caspase family protein [Rhodospirillaceae bacterium]